MSKFTKLESDRAEVFNPSNLAPGASEVVKNPRANSGDATDPVSVPGHGRSPGEGNGNPLQYSYLENPMDREAWWATVHRVAKSRTRLSDFTFQQIIEI